jgi:hypothetical protein
LSLLLCFAAAIPCALKPSAVLSGLQFPAILIDMQLNAHRFSPLSCILVLLALLATLQTL